MTLTTSEPGAFYLTPIAPCGAPRGSRADAITEVGRMFRGTIDALAFLSSGELLALVSGALERIDPSSLETLDSWTLGTGVRGVQVLADDRVLVMRANEIALGRFGEEPKVLYQSDRRIGSSRGGYFSAAATPSGSHIVVPTDNGVHVLDASGAIQQTLVCERTTFFGPERQENAMVAISPSGTLVARWESRDGPIWRDGAIVSRQVQVTDKDGRRTEQRPVGVRDVTFLSDDRFVKEGSVYDGEGKHLAGFMRGLGGLTVASGRIVGADNFGGHYDFDPESFKRTAHPHGESFYGSMPTSVAPAVNASHTATYAPASGELIVTSAGGKATRDGHRSSLDGLRVSDDGTRLSVKSPFQNGAGLLLDRTTQTVRTITPDEGMQGFTVSDDGEHVLLTVGTNLKPRTMHIGTFASGTPEPVHKCMPWSRGTLGFAGRFYAHAAYNLNDNGWVGVYEIGKKRAAAKVKGYPWRFDLSRDGGTLAIVGSPRKDGKATLYDLTKKAAVQETIKGAVAIALGSSGATVAYETRTKESATLHLRGESTCTIDLAIDHERCFAFCEDDSLLFVSHASGLDAYETTSGEHVATLVTRVATKSLCARGGLLFALGADSVIRVFGVAGEAPEERAAKPKAVVEIAPATEEVLPTTRAWTFAGGGALPTFELGGRTLTVKRVDGKVALFEGDQRVKSLRKRKSDDATQFAAAKATWKKLKDGAKSGSQGVARALKQALRTGRTATADELLQMIASAEFAGTIWESVDRETRGSIRDGALRDVEGNAIQPATRHRLLHPVRLSEEDLVAWRAIHPDHPQLARPRHRPKNGASKEVEPVDVGGWAKTQNDTVVGILKRAGYARHEDNGHASYAFTLLAPELGAIALVGIDTEHGIARLSFHPWDGTRDGGEPMPFREVDPQLYSEAVQAVIAAYPHDRDR